MVLMAPIHCAFVLCLVHVWSSSFFVRAVPLPYDVVRHARSRPIDTDFLSLNEIFPSPTPSSTLSPSPYAVTDDTASTVVSVQSSAFDSTTAPPLRPTLAGTITSTTTGSHAVGAVVAPSVVLPAVFLVGLVFGLGLVSCCVNFSMLLVIYA